MRAFSEFQNMSIEFWAFVKFISEKLGYTNEEKILFVTILKSKSKGYAKRKY